MKKIILVLFLMLSVSGICVAENTATLDPCGYRGAKWGMTEQEVKKAIPDVKWEKVVGVLLFRDKIFNYDATAKFHFKAEQLERVEIIMSPEVSMFESRGPKIITAFNSLRKNIAQKYGEPTGSSTNITTWTFSSTEISLSIHYIDIPAWVELIYYKRNATNDIEKL